jgi:uncharacterized membrane protein
MSAQQSGNEELTELRDACARLQRQLDLLRLRITRIEAGGRKEEGVTDKTQEEVPTPQPPVVAGPPASPVPPTSIGTPPVAPPARAEPVSAPESNLEQRIGGTWLNRVGAIVLFLAAAFFVKYAFDQGWISPATRVILGGIAGTLLVVLGEYCLLRKMRMFAIGVLGCGVGILYLSVYAAHEFYQLVSPSAAFVFYILVTSLGGAVAVHGQVLPVAILALIGGLATPVLLSTGQNQQVALMTYLLVLDCGFLACAFLRRWDVIRLIAWLGTAILFGVWALRFYDPSAMWRTAGFVFAGYALFHVEAVLALRRQALARPHVVSIIVHANNVAFFAAIYFLLRDALPQWMGLFAVLCAGLQWLIAWRLCGFAPLTASVRTHFWIDGAGMLALAAPLQFDRYLVSLSWAVQAVVTLWFCRRTPALWLRVKGLGILVAASVHLIVFECKDGALQTTLVSVGHWHLSWLILCFVFVGACAYAAAAAMSQSRSQRREEDAVNAGFMVVLGTALVLGIFAYSWERYLATWWWLGLGVLWWLVALRVPSARVVAVVLAFTITVKFLSWDSLLASTSDAWSEIRGLILNRAVVTGALVAIFAAIVRSIAGRLPVATESDDAPAFLSRLFVLLVALTIVWTGTFEIVRSFRFEPFSERFADPRFAMHVALSVFWSVLATVLLAVGFIRRIGPLRYFALALYAVTLVKVFFVDLAHLEMVHRVISFAVLGVMLLAASLLYQKLSSRLTRAATSAALRENR